MEYQQYQQMEYQQYPQMEYQQQWQQWPSNDGTKLVNEPNFQMAHKYWYPCILRDSKVLSDLSYDYFEKTLDAVSRHLPHLVPFFMHEKQDYLHTHDATKFLDHMWKMVDALAVKYNMPNLYRCHACSTSLAKCADCGVCQNCNKCEHTIDWSGF